MGTHSTLTLILALAAGPVMAVTAQQPARAAAQAPPPSGGAATASPLPSDYVIGAQDVLQIVFWRDADMSVDAVMVRPDGKISLPLLNEIQAAGLTPEQLHVKLKEAAAKYIEEPNVTVVVKEIHSRNVFITGNVARPGAYPLLTDINVLQLIALAGGLLDFADEKNVVIIRTERGRQQHHPFNYKDVVKQKNAAQNIALKPGDTVVVP